MKSKFTSRMLTLNIRNVIVREREEIPTVIRASAADFDTIIFSGGKIGYQVKLSLDNLKQLLRFDCEDIIF